MILLNKHEYYKPGYVVCNSVHLSILKSFVIYNYPQIFNDALTKTFIYISLSVFQNSPLHDNFPNIKSSAISDRAFIKQKTFSVLFTITTPLNTNLRCITFPRIQRCIRYRCSTILQCISTCIGIIICCHITPITILITA